MNTKFFLILILTFIIGGIAPAVVAQEAIVADAAVDAITDAVETDFTSEVASIGGRAVLRADIESYAGKYGIAETREAFETIGPDVVSTMARVPANFKSEAFSFMAEDGTDSLYAFQSAARINIFEADGLPAGEAMVRYPGIAQDAIARDGLPAAEALDTLDSTDACRLDAMIDDGSLAKEGNVPTLLGRIANGGDKAFSVIWDNRIGLAKTAAVVGLFALAADGIGHVAHAIASAISGVGSAINTIRHSTVAAVVCLVALVGLLVGILTFRKAVVTMSQAIFRHFKSFLMRWRKAVPAATVDKPPSASTATSTHSAD